MPLRFIPAGEGRVDMTTDVKSTAIVSLWTAVPMQSVLDWAMGDHRMSRGWFAVRRRWLGEAHPRDVGSQPTASGSRYV